nr:GtrA family protein [Nocardioides flavescens]
MVFRQLTGPLTANLLALLVTAVANTAANRRLTFGVRGRQDALRHQVQGLVVFAVGLGVTSATLWGLEGAGHVTEVVALTAANLLVTVMRFVALRTWVFARHR